MAMYTLNHRIFIVKRYYQSGNSIENVKKDFPEVFPEFELTPSDNNITELVNLFEEYGNVQNNKVMIDSQNELTEVETEMPPSNSNISIEEIKMMDKPAPEHFSTLIGDDNSSELRDEDDEDGSSGEYEDNSDDKISGIESSTLDVNTESKRPKKLSSKVKLTLCCEICDKTFNRRARYDRHMNGHKNTCPVCRKRVRDLKVHMRRHTGEKSYQCSQCGIQFHRYDRLRCHMVSHSDERPFPCETCNKAFKTRKHLQEHGKTHLSADNRPIKCEVCGKGFLYNVDLKKHSRIHTGEKPSLCIVCGKSFASNEILKVHKRIHTGEKPYQCPYCDEKFSRFGSLHTHKRIHTGEKPYKCTFCEKSFYDSGSRRSHEHVHIGDFPYKCLHCDKAYNHLSSLKSHMNYTH